MARREVIAESIANHHGNCDESKCVSKPFSHDGSFVCYGNGSISHPMMCADGFLPVVTDGPAYLFVTNITLWHFTCCPPSHLPTHEEHKIRHCTDPITISNKENTNNLCENEETRKYPRLMKPTLIYFNMEVNSYVCCHSILTNRGEPNVFHFQEHDRDSISFLEDTDCVPYKNEFYGAPNAQNQIGMLRPITCDFPDGDFSFPFPRPIGNGTIEDVASTGQYQCCKNGPALPPFIEDKGFKVMLYPIVALWSIAAVLSFIVAVALLIPLVTQLRNGSFQQKNLQLSRSFRKINGEPRYSTYNLYLVYLAALDLFISLVELALYGSYVDQKYYRGFYGSLAIPWNSDGLPLELVISIFYASANMGINSIICYEIVLLLQCSQRAQRINQPRLCKVNVQVDTVIFFSAIYCSSVYFLIDASQKATVRCDFETSKKLRIFLHVLSVVLLLPFLYVVYATILIWYRGYLPSIKRATRREKAMRELAFFFFRVVAVFIVIWFPMVALFVSVYMTEGDWTRLLCYCLMSTQPIWTFCMILTKSDARKYLLRLVSLSYCSKRSIGGNSDWASIDESARSSDTPLETCSSITTSRRQQWRHYYHKGSVSSFNSNINADELYNIALDDIESAGEVSRDTSAKSHENFCDIATSEVHEEEEVERPRIDEEEEICSGIMDDSDRVPNESFNDDLDKSSQARTEKTEDW